ncbi:MAG TPA: phasin family protein [Aliidongia sp.]|nr:phasin family protein [Aliidongia sp.]
MTPTINGYDELTAISKANLDAIVQANRIFAKGFEEISKEVFGLTQSSLESAASTAKAMFAAKTLKDVVELNADFTRTHFDKMLANSTKLGEMSVKLATDTIAPITARATATVEKAAKPAA